MKYKLNLNCFLLDINKKCFKQGIIDSILTLYKGKEEKTMKHLKEIGYSDGNDYKTLGEYLDNVIKEDTSLENIAEIVQEVGLIPTLFTKNLFFIGEKVSNDPQEVAYELDRFDNQMLKLYGLQSDALSWEL